MVNSQVVKIFKVALLEIQIQTILFCGEMNSVEREMLFLGKSGHVGVGFVKSEEGTTRVR